MNNFIKKSQFTCTLTNQKISSAAYDYDISLYSDQKYTELGLNYPQHLDQAVAKRKAEYLAGRFAAKQALKNLGINVNQIDSGKHGAPIWPKGIAASITHTNKTAICLAASDQHYMYLGVDIENIVTIATAHQLKSMIIDQHEERLLLKLPVDFSVLFTLAFSAKESLFKAFYPYVNKYLNFNIAKLSAISMSMQTIEFKLAADLNKQLPKDSIIKGRFYINTAEVVTLICRSRKFQKN